MKKLTTSIGNILLMGACYLGAISSASAQENTPGAYPDMQILFEAKHVICYGDETGSISAWATGGQEPYTYNWSNGSSESYIYNLNAGSYSLTIADATGFESSITIEIAQNDSIQVIADVVHASGAGMADGEISIDISGGAINEAGTNFTFEWSNEAETLNQTNLTPGFYFLHITDELGCTKSEKIKVMSGLLDLDEIYTLTPSVNEDTGIVLYPNPSVGQVTVAYNSDRITSAQIIPLNGGQLIQIETNSGGKNSFDNLPRGEYVIKFFSGNELVGSERLRVL
jgi:hypothetical protein